MIRAQERSKIMSNDTLNFAYYIGIDWATTQHVVHVDDPSGKQVLAFEIRESLEGYGELDRQLATLGVAIDQLPIALETPHGLLLDHLLGRGYRVYAINPKLVKKQREAMWPNAPKDDWRDAFLLAYILRTRIHRLHPLVRDSEESRELGQLTADRLKWTQMQTQLVNQLSACLRSYYVVALTLFSSVDTQIAHAFLRAYPDPEPAAQASHQTLTQFFRKAGYSAPRRIPKLIEQLKAPAPRAESVTAHCAQRQMLALLDQLEVVHRTLDAYADRIEVLFSQHSYYEVFSSLPGGGGLLGASLCGQLGEAVSRFGSAAVAQAFAGTAPVTKRSGKSRHVHLRLACDKVLRTTLQYFAFASLRLSNWARQVYDQARSRGLGHHAALRIVAHKWLKIIFAIIRDRSRYQEEKFIQARATA